MLQHGNEAGHPAASPGVSRRRVLTTMAGAGAAVASPALLTGCGTAQAKGGNLQFWNFYGPQRSPDPAINAQSKWFVDMVDQWNATHKRQIDLVYLPQPTYLNGFKLPSAFATGEGPDIFMLSPGDFLRYYNGGVLEDLTPHMEKAAVDDFGSALDSRKVDGAGPWTTFRTITWPLLRPTSFFVLMMSTVAAITGGLDLIFVLTNGGPANGTSLAIFYIYQQAFGFGEYGYASAMGSFLVLIMVAVSAVIFKFTRGGRFYDGE